ncbi:MAG: glycosyltransferase [Coriobacteriia bacterium]|nr:glycosyltransferase [Coriobacteriia bacterium]
MGMRIGLFVDMYLPHISGVTNHVRLIKRSFETAGHDVFLITFGSTHHPDDESNVVRNLGVPWGSTGWNYGPAFNKQTRDLIPTLDIIHTHHPHQSGSYLLHHVKKNNKPLVFTNHSRYDLYADTYAKAVPYTSRHKLNARYLSYFTSKCNLVIAPSEGIVDWLAEYAQYEGAVVIPNGIDLTAFRSDDLDPHKRSVCRSRLGVAQDDVLLCYVGRVSHEKNISYLLSEFARLAAGDAALGDRLKLMLVGDGTEMAYAQGFAQRHGLDGRIITVGAVDYELIPDYMAMSDAFITGSVSEVHPLVVIEALAAGLPVIAVHSPGISDTVEHGKSGFLAASPESKALMYEAAKIVHDADVRERLSRGARERSKNYCIDNTAGQLLGLYRSFTT